MTRIFPDLIKMISINVLIYTQTRLCCEKPQGNCLYPVMRKHLKTEETV